MPVGVNLHAAVRYLLVRDLDVSQTRLATPWTQLGDSQMAKSTRLSADLHLRATSRYGGPL